MTKYRPPLQPDLGNFQRSLDTYGFVPAYARDCTRICPKVWRSAEQARLDYFEAKGSWQAGLRLGETRGPVSKKRFSVFFLVAED